MSEIAIHNATDQDIWPSSEDRPDPELRAEIRRVAETITDAEVRERGSGWADWYVRFVIAQERVESQRKHRAEQQEKAAADEAKVAAAKAAARYPTAEAWAKPRKYRKLLHKDELSAEDREFEDFHKQWCEDHAGSPLPVFRKDVAAQAGMTINNGRFLFRQMLAMLDDISCVHIHQHRKVPIRIDEREARIKELEARKLPTYKGVWQDGQTYGETDLVTYGGSMWFCRNETTEVSLCRQGANPDCYCQPFDWRVS